MIAARRGTTGLAIAWTAILASVLAAEAAVGVSEYKVKAAFLLNFGKYVEWPESALGSDLGICVFGRDPFGRALDDTLDGRTVASRPVKARRVTDVEELGGCHILFVSRAGESRLEDIVAAVGDTPVLIVGEQDRFARDGGMINFIEVDKKVRFEINEAAARRAGLKISSKLLRLAKIVE